MFLAFVWADAQAVVIPAGTYYFDNSKVNYSTVKFVYGNDAENVTHILQLTKTEEGLWTFNIGKTVEGQTHYFFTNSALETGEHYEKVTTVKDLIVQRSEHRTQTFKDVDNVPMSWEPHLCPTHLTFTPLGYGRKRVRRHTPGHCP